jgi:hypothetical protein
LTMNPSGQECHSEGFAADAARSEEQQDPGEHYCLVLDDPSSPT